MRKVWWLCVLGACAGRTAQTVEAPAAPAATAPAAPEVETVPLETVGLREDFLDRGADPCEDFYQFACGGWLARTEIPADQAQWGMFNEIYQRNEKVLRDALERAARDPGDDPGMKKLGDYWTACMDERAVERAGLRPMRSLLRAARRVRDLPSLAAALPVLHRSGVFVLFVPSAVQDRKDATQVIADIDQSGLGLPGRDYYLAVDADGKRLLRDYQAYVERMLRLAGRRAADARRGAAQVLKLETELARAMLSPVEQRDPVATYNRIDRAGLAREAPLVGWDNYFRVLGHPDVQDVNVHSVAYTRAVDDLLRRFAPAEWRSYLEFHVAHAMAPQLSRRFVDEHFTWIQLVTGQKQPRARWKRCVSWADADLGELLAQPFVAAAFPGRSKTAAEEMVSQVVRAFRDGLPAVDWMDEPTREAAREKLAKLDLMIGYPERWREYDFEVKRNDLAGNRLRATRFELARTLDKIGKPVDRDEFQLSPQTVNAYYDASLNQMVFLAGILQPPFYDVSHAPHVNLGAIGMVVGHELTHGFDDEGAQYDGDGNLSSWWADDVSARFRQRTACVADFYGRHEALPGLKLNGELTNGENIADIGGLKYAYRAWRALRGSGSRPEPPRAGGFTEDQQFFLAHGQAWCEKTSDEFARLLVATDPHAPARFRVNGPVSNLPEFAEAFGCRPGQAMRPEKTCTVW